MRLIDADALKERWTIASPEPYNTDAAEVLDSIDDTPTAYDIDKVVEQLKDHAIEFEAFGICSDYVELTHAIEILKGGGTDG